jgi:hypothetical protein
MDELKQIEKRVNKYLGRPTSCVIYGSLLGGRCTLCWLRQVLVWMWRRLVSVRAGTAS